MIARLANTKLVLSSTCQKRQEKGFRGGQNISNAFMQVLYFHDDEEYDRWNEWKREKSYFSNLLHNLSVFCTKNISHCQTDHQSSSKEPRQKHKMFFWSSKKCDGQTRIFYNMGGDLKSSVQGNSILQGSLWLMIERRDGKESSWQIYFLLQGQGGRCTSSKASSSKKVLRRPSIHAFWVLSRFSNAFLSKADWRSAVTFHFWFALETSSQASKLR